MMYQPTLVSIFIPTRNGRKDLERLLPVLFGQQVAFPFEVVCIDSSSTDGTWELLGNYPISRKRIAAADFSHGGTRNDGVAMSKGEVVVLLTQDALPIGNNWLSRLISNYEDSTAAGVYCRQVPRPDGTLLPKIDARLMLAGRAERFENRLSEHPEYFKLPPDEGRVLCNFDNICSSLRRSVWERIPFAPLQFAEDLEWGKRVFEANYTIVYDPEVQVMHSHDRSFAYEFKRSFVTFKVLDDLLSRGNDNFGFRLAFQSIVFAPRHLRPVYPELAETKWQERIQCYFIIAARALGHAFFNLWHRRYRNTQWGQQIMVMLHRNV